jgi:hypothetical protein
MESKQDKTPEPTRDQYADERWVIGPGDPSVGSRYLRRTDPYKAISAEVFGQPTYDRLLAATPDLYRELAAADIIIGQLVDLLREKGGIERSFTLRATQRLRALGNARRTG